MNISSVINGSAPWHVEHGEALDVLRSMPDACVDAVVTDPPAGISFMGKTWDHDHGGREGWVRAFAAIFAEALRVLKPGGRALVWSIPRTAHWTACAVEDAGFVIENTIAHVFGTGFPKGKSQLKPAREDWILCRKPGGKVQPLGIDACRVEGIARKPGSVRADRHFDPHTQRDGAELIDAPDPHPGGRWPPNLVLSHADGCERVGEKRVRSQNPILMNESRPMGFGGKTTRKPGPLGHADADGLETVADWRCVDGCPCKLLGEQSGERPVSGAALNGRAATAGNRGIFSEGGMAGNGALHADSGTAARFFPQFEPDQPPFFYAAKASRRERNAGCEGLPERAASERTANVGLPDLRMDHEQRRLPSANFHPTVKPQSLMRWLIRLITPPGGLVLDCFAGSGSTVVAAVAEGMRAIGIEREAEYIEIARARIAHASATGNQSPQMEIAI